MATVLNLGIVDLVALKAPTLIVYDIRTEASPIWCRSSPKPMVSYHTRAKDRLTSGRPRTLLFASGLQGPWKMT